MIGKTRFNAGFMGEILKRGVVGLITGSLLSFFALELCGFPPISSGSNFTELYEQQQYQVWWAYLIGGFIIFTIVFGGVEISLFWLRFVWIWEFFVLIPLIFHRNRWFGFHL